MKSFVWLFPLCVHFHVNAPTNENKFKIYCFETYRYEKMYHLPDTYNRIYCTNRPLTHQIVIDFILKHCQYRDSNPMWQPDADSINVLIHDILYAENEAEKQKLKTRALELLYRNSAGTFEDAVDADRMGQRRAALALFEDEYQYKAFMDDVRVCLSKINQITIILTNTRL